MGHASLLDGCSAIHGRRDQRMDEPHPPVLAHGDDFRALGRPDL